MEQRTNVIYLTTKCNMACEYCYEGNGEEDYDLKEAFLTNEQIDEFVDEMEKMEGSIPSSSISFMGGEPTLAYDGLSYIIDRIIESTKKLGKTYSAVMTTNGVLLDNESYYTKFINLIRYAKDNGFFIDIEISYDGTGHHLRKFRNGSPTQEIVKRVIDKLERNGERFRISYTVSEQNYLVTIEEVIGFLETYKNLINISCSIAFARLDKFLEPGAGFKIKDEFKPYMKELYGIYNIPICGLSCGPCRRCKTATFRGNRYASPTKGIMIADAVTSKKFNQF